jgi:hypothetical protein
MPGEVILIHQPNAVVSLEIAVPLYSCPMCKAAEYREANDDICRISSHVIPPFEIDNAR